MTTGVRVRPREEFHFYVGGDGTPNFESKMVDSVGVSRSFSESVSYVINTNRDELSTQVRRSLYVQRVTDPESVYGYAPGSPASVWKGLVYLTPTLSHPRIFF